LFSFENIPDVGITVLVFVFVRYFVSMVPTFSVEPPFALATQGARSKSKGSKRWPSGRYQGSKRWPTVGTKGSNWRPPGPREATGGLRDQGKQLAAFAREATGGLRYQGSKEDTAFTIEFE
jgi:hypothetical protein